MAMSIPASITGGAQTGFTAPTYTTVADQAPDLNSKQAIVSALGGTQAGVTTHSVQSPFTCTVRRPGTLKVLLAKFLNGVTGKFTKVPRNAYGVLTRKGLLIQAGQFDVGIIRTTIDLPAGADTADPANVRALISAHIGLLSANSAGAGDTAVTGSLG